MSSTKKDAANAAADQAKLDQTSQSSEIISDNLENKTDKPAGTLDSQGNQIAFNSSKLPWIAVDPTKVSAFGKPVYYESDSPIVKKWGITSWRLFRLTLNTNGVTSNHPLNVNNEEFFKCFADSSFGRFNVKINPSTGYVVDVDFCSLAQLANQLNASKLQRQALLETKIARRMEAISDEELDAMAEAEVNRILSGSIS